MRPPNSTLATEDRPNRGPATTPSERKPLLRERDLDPGTHLFHQCVRWLRRHRRGFFPKALREQVIYADDRDAWRG